MISWTWLIPTFIAGVAVGTFWATRELRKANAMMDKMNADLDDVLKKLRK